MPAMAPFKSALNLTPNSAGASGPASGLPGTMPVSQMEMYGGCVTILRVSDREALCSADSLLLESVTRAVKVLLPAAPVGIPLRRPFADMVSPGGNLRPGATDLLWGGFPPLALSAVAYGWFCVATGKAVVVITSVAGWTVSVALLVMPFTVAALRTAPPAAAIAIPELLIFAMLLLEEVQLT